MKFDSKEHHCKLLDESDDYIYYNGTDWVMNHPGQRPGDPDFYIMYYCFKCGAHLDDNWIMMHYE